MIETYVRRHTSMVCKPCGDLNWGTSLALRNAVYDALISSDTVIIDLSQVCVINAVGLSALIACLRRARQIGATIQIRHARPQVQRRLDLMTVEKCTYLTRDVSGHDVA